MKNANGPGFDDASRERGFGNHHQDIQWIAIVPACLRDETIVTWIMHGAEEHAAELDYTEMLVVFVLVAMSPWDFHYRVHYIWSLRSWCNIMPQV
jgi:hypothetical protein